jgi:hypothetical protein
MVKRLALVALAIVAFGFGLAGCDSGSKDSHKGHEHKAGDKH